MIKKIIIISSFFCLVFLASISSLPAQMEIISPDYLTLVNQKVQSLVIYPQEALDQGWEGIAKIRFVINQDGQITDIYVAESSGYPLLDAAALFAVQDASPYPFPNEYKDLGELEILLPVTYQNPENDVEMPPFPQEQITAQEIYQEPILEQLEPPSQVYIENPEPLSETDSTALKLAKEEALFGAKPRKQEPDFYSPNIIPTSPAAEAMPTALINPTPEIDTKLFPDELGYFIELALKNNQPTQVAKEEIKLAQIKVTEAQRNFLPNLKLAGYSTMGEVYNIDYEEREMKIQLDQPFYYSGRLEDTLNQARVNLEITRNNYNRVKIDVMHKTETSYYNMVAAKMHLEQKYALREEALEMLQKIEKLAKAEMITPLELKSAQSWFEQMKFQIESIRQDQFMAETTFKQVLNLKDVPDVKAQTIEQKQLDSDLDALTEIALKNRPEIYLSDLLVKFNDYGQKIEKIKSSKPTIDLVTSYGFYQGHYKTEPWKDSSNWYGGIKANIPWDTSTVNTSATTDNTKPRFGQTSPTSSSTITAELGVMDNFKRISDKKRADIEVERALSDLNETSKTIAFEVQDAFLNYKKAILQLETAQADMKFRRNEAEVTKVRSMVGEASLSNVMESLYQLSDAQSKYYQALVNCQLSLTNLKKACGYNIKI